MDSCYASRRFRTVFCFAKKAYKKKSYQTEVNFES